MNCPQITLLDLRETSRLSPLFTALSRSTGLQFPAVADSLSNCLEGDTDSSEVVTDTCEGRGISEALLPL